MSIKTAHNAKSNQDWLSNLTLDKEQWRQVKQCAAKCRTLSSMLLLSAGFIALLLVCLFYPPGTTLQASIIFITLCVVNVGLFLSTLRLQWVDYIRPLLEIEDWVQQMRSGELQSKVRVRRKGQIAEVAFDLNDFGTMINNLSRDTEQQLIIYTEYTEQKNLSLKILYDVASTINSSLNLSELLEHFLETMTRVIGAKAGSVRLLNSKQEMELVASINCACNLNGEFDGFIYQDTLELCHQHIEHRFFKEKLGLIVVPLQYQAHTLGIFNLFIQPASYRENDDYKELFTSIGKHLGMAIAKARLDEESHKLSIMQERNRLSYELHDSLAQTLTSIRFQIRILDDILQQRNEYDSWQHLERIENTVEEANTELRSLIAHFQAPISNQPIIDAVKDLIKRFRSESNIPIFFQHNIEQPIQFSDRVHLEVMRIVQEALHNLRKHSDANVARVMLRELDGRRLQILIEDDGVGIEPPPDKILPGQQIGLKSMRERASRIKAKFTLDSDPGEGTRVILEVDLEALAPEDIVTIETSLGQSIYL
jgi:two-component system nitrate/nitrite sensor histidine kinase NarX